LIPVNDLDNGFYEISNEDTASPADAEWQYHMIRFIKEYERSKTPAASCPHDCSWPGTDDILYQSPADWVSPAAKVPMGRRRKVILNDTDHSYLWIGLKKDGPAAQRAWVWENFTQGNQCLFMDLISTRATIPGVTIRSMESRTSIGTVCARRWAKAGATPSGWIWQLRYPTASSRPPGFVWQTQVKEYQVFVPNGGEATVDLSQSARSRTLKSGMGVGLQGWNGELRAISPCKEES
jgi:hypothetical protein